MPILPCLSRSLVLYVLDKRAKLLYHVLQGKKTCQDIGLMIMDLILLTQSSAVKLKQKI